MWLYIFGFAVHVVFFISVFDIYFRTPIIHGMEPQSSPLDPEAKRLVLFVADGLRADSFFNFTNGTSRAPYLRSVIEHEGTWGVSHTHVPTESRPGHVAILAGLYEDPSAIARGWRENPVHFDHILNQTRYAWAWGSPDIVPMFASGPHSAHISTATYTAQEEDFASADASKLDTWVFDKLEQLLRNATTDKRLHQDLHSNRVMFFLHLLGLDTNGHSHKPHSQEYLRNIELVDKGIQRAVHFLNDFYRDNQTAFIFTADHGMTSWGSHGAGEASETETPIVAWGRGVSLPQDPSSFQASRMVFDARVSDWGLSHVRRHDMHQADIAPLMAALLNTPVPVNNVGTLPVEYLSGSAQYRAEALFANARQLLAQYRARRQARQSAALPLLFSPYKPLSLDAEISYLTKIRNALNKERYEEVISTCHTLLHLSETGINYYHNYDRPGLTLSITLAFIGWMALIVCQILQYDTGVLRVASNSIEGRRAAKKSSFWCGVVACWGIATLLLNIVQGSPVQHLVYHLLPVAVWGVLVWRWLGVVRVAWLLLHHYNMIWETAIRILAIFIGVQILVFSFHARMMLCAGLVCVGAWPLVLYSPSTGGGGTSLTLCWLGACLLLSSFAILPPVVGMAPSYSMVEVAGLIALILGGCALYGCGVEGTGRLAGVSAGSAVQGVLVLVTLATIHSTSSSLDAKQGLPPLNQWSAWLLLASSVSLPMLVGSQLVMGRLLSVSVALLCPFLLLSIRHEAFFYLSLAVAMMLWVILEFYLAGSHVQIAALKYSVWGCEEGDGAAPRHDRLLEWSDVRRAYFFLFFIVLAFFGTGNLASVNSFDPSFVYCFVTVFSPFVMGGLLLLKILIPFLLVACFFRAICVLLEVPITAVFQVFLVLSDLMALQFFLVIRTEGSWLAIGSSLSHFVISLASTAFLHLLMALATPLTTVSIFGDRQRDLGKGSLPSVMPYNTRRRPHRD